MSEQQLVSCDTQNGGCNGGTKELAFGYYSNHGPMSENAYPYVAMDTTCQYDANSAWNIHTDSSSPATYVTFDDLNSMYAALQKTVLSVSICASSTAFHTYSSGIFNDPTCGDQHNHATNVVGYGTVGTTNYWLMRNSWGTDWGEQGYMRLQVYESGNGICGIQMWPSYPNLL
jgi:C1A family cysteine protease